MIRFLILKFAVVCLLGAGLFAADPVQARTQDELVAEYRRAIQAHRVETANYWAKIKKFKSIRKERRRAGKPIKRKHFVLNQPPKYKGPKKPTRYVASPRQTKIKTKPTKKKSTRRSLPLANELRRAAADLYGLELPQYAERDFKIAFAREAQRYRMRAEQVIGVYALETGGRGPFDLMSGEIIGRDKKCRLVQRKGRARSTALGYFQLLNANTSTTLAGNARKPAEQHFANRLRALADQSRGKRKKELRRKAKILDKMVADLRAAIARMPGRKNNWAEYQRLSKTRLGYAIHALNLDLDIGPMIQMSKLAFVRDYAIKKGLGNPPSHRLELMNLVGYPRGGLMLEPVAYEVPTANFVTAREIKANYAVLGDKTVKGSLVKIERVIGKRKLDCGSQEFFKMFEKVGGA